MFLVLLLHILTIVFDGFVLMTFTMAPKKYVQATQPKRKIKSYNRSEKELIVKDEISVSVPDLSTMFTIQVYNLYHLKAKRGN